MERERERGPRLPCASCTTEVSAENLLHFRFLCCLCRQEFGSNGFLCIVSVACYQKILKKSVQLQ